jgi:hypothetical protein
MYFRGILAKQLDDIDLLKTWLVYCDVYENVMVGFFAGSLLLVVYLIPIPVFLILE